MDDACVQVCLGGEITEKLKTHPMSDHRIAEWDPAFTHRMQQLTAHQGALATNGQMVWAVTPGGDVRQTVSAWYKGGDCKAEPGKPYVAQMVHYCGGQPVEGPFQVEQLAVGGQLAAFLDSWSQSLDALIGGKTKGGEYGCQFQVFVTLPSLCQVESFAASSRAAALYQRLLREVFSPKSGYGSTATKARHETYGELTTEGFLTMLDLLPRGYGLDASSVLYDLGSGVGKFVFGAVMMSPVKTAVGIEIVDKIVTVIIFAVACFDRGKAGAPLLIGTASLISC